MASLGGMSDYDDHNRNKAVTGFFTDVEHFNRETGLDDYVGVRKEITRRHWRAVTGASRCFNPSCHKQFSGVFDRHHHCRKCGEVFCSNCTQYKRRLNFLAHFDTDGQVYKVCKACFEKDVLTDGHSRSHTSDFIQMRSTLKRRTADSDLRNLSSMWKTPLSFSKECQRLLDGFRASLKKSEFMRTIREVTSILSVPDWMKSSVWEQEMTVSKCRVCLEKFSIINQKLNCVVCGTAVCKACSFRELLLYVPDGVKGREMNVKMAIIGIVGCPEVEPEISVHLRVCPTCKERLISQQVEDVEEDGIDLSVDFMTLLDKLHQRFHRAEQGVRKQLPNYRNVVESLEDGSRRTAEHSNMKVLAKAQEDLADALASHVTLVQQLKKLSPSTAKQGALLKTYITAKCEFYLDNMSAFRVVKNKLSNSVPAESLDFIQRIMDKNAIISTHLALRQLVYEVLHLTQSHQLGNDLPALLVSVEQEVETQVKKCLLKGGENIAEHMDLVKEMTRMAIKDHKLIRIPRQAMKTQRRRGIGEMIASRCEDILNQVVNQLQLASANRSFQSAKGSLDEALTQLKDIRQNWLDEAGKEDFLLVEKRK